MYFGEGIGVARNSKGHIFIFTRSGDTRLFQFDQNGKFVREWGVGLYGFEMAHGVRVDAQDNIWTVDEGTNMVVKFSPEGRVVMMMGRRPEPLPAPRYSNAQNPGALNRKYRFRPADRRHLGPAGQHLRVRRLRQLTSCEIRQERAFRRAVRRHPRDPAESAQHAALDHRRRARQHLRRRSRQPPHRGLEQRPDAARHLHHVGDPWAVCVSPGPAPVPVQSSNSNPDNNNPLLAGRSPARSTRWSWTARSSVSSARRARALASSAPSMRSTAAIRIELFVSEISAWRAQKIILSPSKMQTTSSSAAAR